jgi:hypothetical protein
MVNIDRSEEQKSTNIEAPLGLKNVKHTIRNRAILRLPRQILVLHHPVLPYRATLSLINFCINVGNPP